MTSRIPAAEITGFYGALIKKFSAKMFGKVPESLGVLWHNQPVLKASMGFGQKLQKWNSCDESLKSYAQDVLEYAEAMSTTPVTVTDELAARLLEQLGSPGLVELTSVIGFANLTTRGNVALGIESEGFADACGLKPLAARSGAR